MLTSWRTISAVVGGLEESARIVQIRTLAYYYGAIFGKPATPSSRFSITSFRLPSFLRVFFALLLGLLEPAAPAREFGLPALGGLLLRRATAARRVAELAVLLLV